MIFKHRFINLQRWSIVTRKYNKCIKKNYGMCVVENIIQIIDELRTDKETLVVDHYSDMAHSDNDYSST